jgi:hypothetical protein
VTSLPEVITESEHCLPACVWSVKSNSSRDLHEIRRLNAVNDDFDLSMQGIIIIFERLRISVDLIPGSHQRGASVPISRENLSISVLHVTGAPRFLVAVVLLRHASGQSPWDQRFLALTERRSARHHATRCDESDRHQHAAGQLPQRNILQRRQVSIRLLRCPQIKATA